MNETEPEDKNIVHLDKLAIVIPSLGKIVPVLVRNQKLVFGDLVLRARIMLPEAILDHPKKVFFEQMKERLRQQLREAIQLFDKAIEELSQ